MLLDVKLLDSGNTIKKKILSAYGREVNAYFNRNLFKIRDNLRELLYAALVNTEEYRSLTMHGELQKHFGLLNMKF